LARRAKTLSITKFSITTFSIAAFSITTLSIKGLYLTLSKVPLSIIGHSA
jgi:hypothetical protein